MNDAYDKMLNNRIYRAIMINTFLEGSVYDDVVSGDCGSIVEGGSTLRAYPANAIDKSLSRPCTM